MNNLLNVKTPAESQASILKSEFGLENHGLTNLRLAYWNLPPEGLYEEIVFRTEGIISHQGPIVINTGKHTARAETGGRHSLRITKATLLYEGEEATPGLLARIADSNTFHVNRTAQVTQETSSVLKVDVTAEGGSDSEGVVQVRPRPAE